MPKDIRVLIVDDNRTFRKGVRLQLEQATGITVVGEAGNGVDAIAIARVEKVDVVLMDLQMSGMDGIEATRRLTRASTRAPRVIALTSHATERHATEAVEAGASGYLVKTHDSALLVSAIFATARGEGILSSRVTAPIIRKLTQREQRRRGDVPSSVLSPAELRVVVRLSQGVTSNEKLADDLGLSVNTVRSQLRGALRKTELDDRTQLVLWAIRQGIAGAGG